MSAMEVQTSTSALTEIKVHGVAPSTLLPDGFPTSIDGNAAWVASDFSGSRKNEMIYVLTDKEKAEANIGLANFKNLGIDGTKINKHNFILPTLGAKLQILSKEVHRGRGFVIIRGLDVTSNSVGDLTMIYMGIASYIADKVGSQDGSGNALVHIITNKKFSSHHRHSQDAITFHTEENADVVAWLTRSAAAEGGRCVISSASTIYNVLSSTRPDLVRVLAAGNWPVALPRYQCRPLIFNEDGRVLFNFGRAALLGSTAHPRKDHLPSVTKKQQEALDAIEAIARATEFAFATQPGDMHFISNMTVLHRRDGFTESPDARRHLVRMRLSDSVYGSHIPPLSSEWADAFVDKGDRTWHIEPMPSAYFPLRKYPN